MGRPSFYTLDRTIVIIKLISEEPCDEFTVHKGLLCHYSPYFVKAFDGPFKEAKDRSIDLPDVTSETFKCFMDWLYNDELMIRDNCRAMEPPDPVEGGATQLPPDMRHGILLDIYVFADKYDVPLLRNDVMFAWIARDIWDDSTNTVAVINTDTILRAFESLPEESCLCRYMAYSWTAFYKGEVSVQILTCLPHAFLCLFAVVSIKWRQYGISDYPHHLRRYIKAGRFFECNKDERTSLLDRFIELVSRGEKRPSQTTTSTSSKRLKLTAAFWTANS